MHISFVDSGLIMVGQTRHTFGVLSGPDDSGEILHGADRCARWPEISPPQPPWDVVPALRFIFVLIAVIPRTPKRIPLFCARPRPW